MSDLAPFVAACIRDKVVLDLLEENERLRAVIEKYEYNAVEVTGSAGFPVYSSGQFNVDASYEESDEMWHISLDQKSGCKLDELLNVEIRKSGAVAKLLDLEECGGFVDTFSGNQSADIDIVLTAGVGIACIEIGIKVEGIAEERWQSLSRLTGSDFVACLATACSTTSAATAFFQYILVDGERK